MQRKHDCFVQALPTKSLAVKGEKCTWDKMSKKKNSVIVGKYGGRNGKALKPRCFKNLKLNNLAVIWRNNQKAWMIAATMEEWINVFNAKVKKENRNAILFLWQCYLPPKGNTFKCENHLGPNKCNKCITAYIYGCYLHIQIALQTISDAIFVFECRRSR
jgi:hypothetical protein